MPDKQYILVIGNPIDGLRFVGPITLGDALCPEQDIDDDWWIAELESPDAP